MGLYFPNSMEGKPQLQPANAEVKRESPKLEDLSIDVLIAKLQKEDNEQDHPTILGLLMSRENQLNPKQVMEMLKTKFVSKSQDTQRQLADKFFSHPSIFQKMEPSDIFFFVSSLLSSYQRSHLTIRLNQFFFLYYISEEVN